MLLRLAGIAGVDCIIPRQGTGDEVESSARHLIDVKRDASRAPGSSAHHQNFDDARGNNRYGSATERENEQDCAKDDQQAVAITAWRWWPSIRSARGGDSVPIVLTTIVVPQ